MTFDRFSGTVGYITSPALTAAVNAAIALERPLLIRGEPGTGKTRLANAIAESLGLRLITWMIKSTTEARHGLYEYDVVERLHDSRFGGHDVSNIKAYIRLGKLGEAFTAAERVVLLIDEVDKADLEFPNDLLNELDQMEFYIRETDETVRANHRPVVVITSNAEKELPDAFLRRCVFHYIEFPDAAQMAAIVRVHFPDLDQALLDAALKAFYRLRSVQELKKRPSTSELLDWLFVLRRSGVPVEKIERDLPFLGSLIKKEQDLHAARVRLGR